MSGLQWVYLSVFGIVAESFPGSAIIHRSPYNLGVPLSIYLPLINP
jgi:hypothetical protein